MLGVAGAQIFYPSFSFLRIRIWYKILGDKSIGFESPQVFRKDVFSAEKINIERIDG